MPVKSFASDKSQMLRRPSPKLPLFVVRKAHAPYLSLLIIPSAFTDKDLRRLPRKRLPNSSLAGLLCENWSVW